MLASINILSQLLHLAGISLHERVNVLSLMGWSGIDSGWVDILSSNGSEHLIIYKTEKHWLFNGDFQQPWWSRNGPYKGHILESRNRSRLIGSHSNKANDFLFNKQSKANWFKLRFHNLLMLCFQYFSHPYPSNIAGENINYIWIYIASFFCSTHLHLILKKEIFCRVVKGNADRDRNWGHRKWLYKSISWKTKDRKENKNWAWTDVVANR